MRYIVFTDGSKYKLVDVSYDNFVTYHEWFGSSDIAYDEYKRERDMHELYDFNDETLNEGYTIEYID